MRLLQMPPPRRPASEDWGILYPVEVSPSVKHESLGEPAPTHFHRRHLFNPKDGWFRRTERAANKFLSRRVFPRVPGIREPYRKILERDLTVSEAQVSLRNMGGSGGVRVLVISDIHGGPFIDCDVLRQTFERLLTLRPELILLPGDFATVSVHEVEQIAPALEILDAPLGVYGVLGNHDYYVEDSQRVVEILEASGIELLQNRSTEVETRGASFLLGGVDDLLNGRPDFAAALARRRNGVPTVLMSHNPDVFPEAVRRRVSLVVSGHTHGGQIRIPGLSVLVRMSRFSLDEGRFAVEDSELIVSRGLGVTGLPLRYACPPEALLLTFVPG